MAAPKGGNFGKVLEIDLSKQTYKTRPVSDEGSNIHWRPRPRGLLRRDGIQGGQERPGRGRLRLRGPGALVRNHGRFPPDLLCPQESLHGPYDTRRVRRPPGKRGATCRLGRPTTSRAAPRSPSGYPSSTTRWSSRMPRRCGARRPTRAHEMMVKEMKDPDIRTAVIGPAAETAFPIPASSSSAVAPPRAAAPAWSSATRSSRASPCAARSTPCPSSTTPSSSRPPRSTRTPTSRRGLGRHQALGHGRSDGAQALPPRLAHHEELPDTPGTPTSSQDRRRARRRGRSWTAVTLSCTNCPDAAA